MQMLNKSDTVRGGSRAAATSKMERLEAVNYYHKVLHLGCCSIPRSASETHSFRRASVSVVVIFSPAAVTFTFDFFFMCFIIWY